MTTKDQLMTALKNRTLTARDIRSVYPLIREETPKNKELRDFLICSAPISHILRRGKMTARYFESWKQAGFPER